MQGLTQTRFGRLYVAVAVVVLGITAFKFTPAGRVEDPSWPLSVLLNSTFPLLVVAIGLAFAARNRFLGRDWLTLIVALAATVVMAAAGVAVDQKHGAADFLLNTSGPLLAGAALALMWSGLARRRAA